MQPAGSVNIEEKLGSTRRLSRGSFVQKPGYRGKERVLANGLGKIVVAACIEAVLAVTLHGVCGQGEYGPVPTGLSEGSGGFMAIKSRHLDIENHEVKGVLTVSGLQKGIQGGLSIGFLMGRGTRHAQKMRDQPAIVSPIIGQQNSGSREFRLPVGGSFRADRNVGRLLIRHAGDFQGES